MRYLALVLTLAGCTGLIDGTDEPEQPDAAIADAPPAVSDAAPVAEHGPLLGSYFFTFYYVAEEQRYLDQGLADDTAIYQRVDGACQEMATVPLKFSDALRIEGTGRLSDGRMVNYSASCTCPNSPCYHFLPPTHPWGSGAQSRPLVPFRSVAVDRDVVYPFGRKLYVAELDGVMMPGDPPWGGFVHDGCVSADDTGGSIDGQHLDFFSALRPYYLQLAGELDLVNDHVTVYDGGARCN